VKVVCLFSTHFVDWSERWRLLRDQHEPKILGRAQRGKRLRPCPWKASTCSGNQQFL